MYQTIPRPFFSPEHQAFRDQLRRFCERDIGPQRAEWERAHGVPRSVWKKVDDNGMLCCWQPEEEEGAGGDLAGIRARCERDREDWVLTGQKTFITNGHDSDVIVVATKTGPQRGTQSVSTFVVTGEMAGSTRGCNLHKICQHAQDTAELFFDRVRLPADHLFVEVHKGFHYFMQEVPQERLLIAVQCQTRAEAIFETTVAYVKDCKTFRQRVADFQNTRFKLAALWAKLQVGRAFCDRLIQQHMASQLTAVEDVGGKLWHSEMINRVADVCLQLHTGHGYMQKYSVARP